MLFEYLYNLPADDTYWKNDVQFTRPVFTRAAQKVMSELKIAGPTVDLNVRTSEFRKTREGKGKVRGLFKEFYKNDVIQEALKHKSRSINPWKHWIDNHQEATNEFLTNFKAAMQHAARKGHNVVDAAKLTAIEVTLKKA